MKRDLGQKLLDTEHLMSWRIQLLGQSSSLFSIHVTVSLSKLSYTATDTYTSYLHAPDSTLFQHFHQFYEFLDDHPFITFHILMTLFEPFMQLKNT